MWEEGGEGKVGEMEEKKDGGREGRKEGWTKEGVGREEGTEGGGGGWG